MLIYLKNLFYEKILIKKILINIKNKNLELIFKIFIYAPNFKKIILSYLLSYSLRNPDLVNNTYFFLST